MTMNDTATAIFSALRPRLFALAYRMLGVRADADDVVQDTWLRWQGSTSETMELLQSPEAWLVTITTRLAIDRLRSRQAERAAYTGYWLPEPLMELDERTPESAAEQADEVSVALMWVMERLAPVERAAYLLREVFDQDYSDLAAILGKSEASCRQLVHRAQERVRLEQPRFEVPQQTHRDLLQRFMQAAEKADRSAMKALLADDVALVADGGRKVSSYPRILVGAGRVAGSFWSLEHMFPGHVSYRMARINGRPGLLRYVDGELESVQSFETDGQRILRIHSQRNPDKLLHLRPL